MAAKANFVDPKSLAPKIMRPGDADGPTVKMLFLHPVLLTVDNYNRMRFEAGLNDVPQSILDQEHLKAYLEANGVKVFNAKTMPLPSQQQKDVQRAIDYTVSKGFPRDVAQQIVSQNGTKLILADADSEIAEAAKVAKRGSAIDFLVKRGMAQDAATAIVDRDGPDKAVADQAEADEAAKKGKKNGGK